MSRTLGDVIFSYRDKLKMSPEELAYKAGVSYSTIYKIETGAREPSVGLLKKLAKALGIPASEIWKQVEKAEVKKVI